MWSSIRAGVVYFVIVFAIGFILGTIRVLLVAPRTGELGAVLIEVPLMLMAAWIVCSSLTRRYRVAPRLMNRVAMGVSAFVLLMMAELLLSICVFGNTIESTFTGYLTPHGFVGLGGQLMFALFPLLQLHGR
jgi:hypothetical protein